MGWFAPARTWECGDWSLQLRGDEIADIAYDGRRVLRSIRAVVRDHDWATPDLVVDSVETDVDALTLHVHTEGDAPFAGTVTARVDGAELAVELELTAAATYRTNRTGLVVLHPPQTAGSELAVTHPHGGTRATRFPVEINPHQPVVDIAGLAWSDDGIDIDVRFAGDVFEMEDQRNWTDASYKTYSRPLALPFPYEVAAGEHVRQRVIVTVTSVQVPADVGADADRIVLTEQGTFPQIGLGAATAPDPAPTGLPSVGQVRLVELDLSTPNWRAALERAATAGLPLDVRVTVDTAGPDASATLAGAVTALAGHDVVRIGAFASSGPSAHVSDATTVDAVRRALAEAGLDTPVVGGSRSHFTELNRERHRLPGGLDGLTTTVTPLFHAVGTEQLVESVAMQRLVAQQAVSYADGAPVQIGPVCLRPRFNNVATAPQPAPTRVDLSEGYGAEFTGGVDERQRAPELAAWTIASAAALAVPWVASLAYFEEWGPRGIRSSSGEPHPVAVAVEALAGLAGGPALRGESPDGLVWAIGARTDTGTVVLAANLGPAARTITVEVGTARIETTLPAGGWARLSL